MEMIPKIQIMEEYAKMVNATDFGLFLKLHRRINEFTQNDMSQKVGISIGLYSDIENSRRHTSNRNILEKMVDALQLSEKDTRFFYSLAIKSKKATEQDLPEYVNEHKSVY